jgi:hypothetical protein
MSHPPIRQEIRLQLLRASDRLRAASSDIAQAIDELDRGDFWDNAATEAKINASIATDQIQTAKGMAQIASMPDRSLR